MEPSDARRGLEPKTLAFPTLAAAVGYAERHGFDHRIEPPAGHSRSSEQALPKSWLSLLSKNARSRDLYQV